MATYRDSLTRAVRKNLRLHRYGSGYGQVTRNGDVLRISKQFKVYSKKVNKDYLDLWKKLK